MVLILVLRRCAFPFGKIALKQSKAAALNSTGTTTRSVAPKLTLATLSEGPYRIFL